MSGRSTYEMIKMADENRVHRIDFVRRDIDGLGLNGGIQELVGVEVNAGLGDIGH